MQQLQNYNSDHAQAAMTEVVVHPYNKAFEWFRPS